VERFAEQADATPSHQVELSGLRRIVGERMLASTREIPQFSVSVKVDASALLTARGELSVTALLARFTARALRAHPRLNSQYDGGALTAFETVNLCVAVATPEGLRVPVVRRAEELTVAELDDRIRELAEMARRNRLTHDDVADGTFTISNLGMYGVTQFTPIINPPQAAILGIGKPLGLFTPDGRGGMQQVELMDLTVSADHRAVDGADVAEFLSTLKDLVETCKIA
jgi:pyruvate dehydrogenase E2 component (dihydrolipoamide acetyltransferase)